MQTARQGIDSHTILHGVIGDPVHHSRSPIMMNRAFAECGINAAYTAFHVTPERLGAAIEGMRALGFRGVNVTIPHKVEVMRYLDEIDEGALAASAVNTVVNEGGRLIGYNTDGIGYVRSLKEEAGVALAGARVLVLGAGGAARGVGIALAREGVASIAIANRTRERAVELAEAIGEYAPAAGFGTAEIGDIMRETDIVVNTTSVGMSPHTDESPLAAGLLRKGLVVSDLVYIPRMTKLLAEAERAGATTHGGLGMLVYQGAYAFELWTGQPAPVDVMRQAVLESLTS
jgi:shikimate dehydrogenase